MAVVRNDSQHEARTEQNRTKQNKTEQNRNALKTILINIWVGDRGSGVDLSSHISHLSSDGIEY
jgi:hypothetical protein